VLNADASDVAGGVASPATGGVGVAPGVSKSAPAGVNGVGVMEGNGIVAMGAGVALMLEVMDSSAHDARQLQTRFDLPVLAAIPRIWLEGDRALLRRQRLDGTIEREVDGERGVGRQPALAEHRRVGVERAAAKRFGHAARGNAPIHLHLP